MVSGRLLLIGASGLATQRLPPTVVASEYAFLYAASAPSCWDFAERAGDRLWLTPRKHPDLDDPERWPELLSCHRNHGVIGIVPDSALADGLPTAQARELDLRFDRDWRTLELLLPVEPR